jgi:hypothetical protein
MGTKVIKGYKFNEINNIFNSFVVYVDLVNDIN